MGVRDPVEEVRVEFDAGVMMMGKVVTRVEPETISEETIAEVRSQHSVLHKVNFNSPDVLMLPLVGESPPLVI